MILGANAHYADPTIHTRMHACTCVFANKLRCPTCGHLSETFDPFMDLSMDLHSTKSSVQEALDLYTSTETLGAGNKRKCSQCRRRVRAEKRLTAQKGLYTVDI